MDLSVRSLLACSGSPTSKNGGVPLPQPIPLGGANCDLLVQSAIIALLGTSPQPSLLINVPLSASLLGERYNAQLLWFGAQGLVGASNGLEVQIGLPLAESELIESFVTNANLDAQASGDTWELGQASPAKVGGDGRHGSFDPTHGVLVAPGIYEWSTDSQQIPAESTMSGVGEVVADGRFYFTDFFVPAGVTVRFVGSNPAQVFVRGVADVQGSVSVDAPDMPAAVATVGPLVSQMISTFDARNGFAQADGQPGGAGRRRRRPRWQWRTRMPQYRAHHRRWRRYQQWPARRRPAGVRRACVRRDGRRHWWPR